MTKRTGEPQGRPPRQCRQVIVHATRESRTTKLPFAVGNSNNMGSRQKKNLGIVRPNWTQQTADRLQVSRSLLPDSGSRETDP